MDHAAAFDVFARPLFFLGLAALAFAPLEHVAPARAVVRSRFATDLAFATAGQVLARLGIVVVVGWLLAQAERFGLERPLTAAVADARARFAVDLAIGLGLFELAGYGYHRLAHRMPALWRLHEVHHSSPEMDWLAGFRQHPLEILLVTLVQNVPLVLLGIPLGAHAAVLAALALHTVFVHANVRVPPGPWTAVLATPGFHHRHHQRDGAPRNFATLFPFLDRLFGSHDGGAAGVIGLPRPLPEGFAGLLARPFRRGA